MKAQEKTMMVLAILVAFMALVVFLPSHISAGDLEPTDPPGSTMHTLEEIYGIVSDNSDKLDEVSNLQVVEVISTYTVTEDDDVVLFNAGAATEDIVVYLPDPSLMLAPKVCVVSLVGDSIFLVDVQGPGVNVTLDHEDESVTLLAHLGDLSWHIISSHGNVLD